MSFALIPGLPDPALLKHIEHDHDINVITRALAAQVSIDKTTVGALAVEPLRGPLPFSTVKGHLPDADGEIGLGAAALHVVAAKRGDFLMAAVFGHDFRR